MQVKILIILCNDTMAFAWNKLNEIPIDLKDITYKNSQRLGFLPVSKACTNKFDIFWQCTYIVYIVTMYVYCIYWDTALLFFTCKIEKTDLDNLLLVTKIRKVIFKMIMSLFHLHSLLFVNLFSSWIYRILRTIGRIAAFRLNFLGNTKIGRSIP
jgi:hypothetical protein